MEQTSYFRVEFFKMSQKTFRLHQITLNNINNQHFQITTNFPNNHMHCRGRLLDRGNKSYYALIQIFIVCDMKILISMVHLSYTKSVPLLHPNPWNFHENLENKSWDLNMSCFGRFVSKWRFFQNNSSDIFTSPCSLGFIQKLRNTKLFNINMLLPDTHMCVWIAGDYSILIFTSFALRNFWMIP